MANVKPVPETSWIVVGQTQTLLRPKYQTTTTSTTIYTSETTNKSSSKAQEM